MDLHSNNVHEHGRNEQIILQFLLKSLHIVLDSRVPSIRPSGHRGNFSSGNQVKKSDKWYNLALGERPAALDSLNFWHRNLMEPVIIDIILVQEVPSIVLGNNGCTTSGYGTLVETVIERWVVQYEHSGTSPQFGESSISYKKTYKKSIILLRSLYSMMRFLPAYRAYRKLALSSKACDFDINYKISSFSAPFTRAEEEVMKQYSFVPVEAQNGRLSISVKYRESLADFNLETSSLFPPEIITDYVGSPATDPLRAFPTMDKGVRATSFPMRGMESPTSTPLQRPHSWTSGLNRGAAFMHNQSFGSPPAHRSSTGRYDLSSSPTDIYGQRTQNYRPQNHHRGTSFDDYQLSPPFSQSSSPSPPAYHSSGNYMQSRLRSETAPVSIPHPMMARSPRYLSPNLSDPSRHSLPPPSPRSTKHDLSSQESPSGIRSLRKSEMWRVGDLSSGSSHKVSRDSKDDSGRFSGLLSSSGSPRIGFSMSSGRLSLQDELDDIDFSCPFIVDDVDNCSSPASQNIGGKQEAEFTSNASTAKRSQDAAVGALVHMLRTAAPLRQNSGDYSSHSMKTDKIEGEFNTTSGFFMARNTSDALEEFRAYKDMRDLLLSKTGTLLISKEDG